MEQKKFKFDFLFEKREKDCSECFKNFNELILDIKNMDNYKSDPIINEYIIFSKNKLLNLNIIFDDEIKNKFVHK